MNARISLLPLLAFAIAALAGCGAAEPPAPFPGAPPDALGPLRTIEVELGGVTATIELAITPREQRQGLMYRESMPENHGMLFVYAQPQYMSFWMKNTKIPLSIAYIREDGVVSNIEEMKPHKGPLAPTEHYRSRHRCLYALEMNQGWFAEHGINEGDPLPLPYDQINEIARSLSAPGSDSGGMRP